MPSWISFLALSQRCSIWLTQYRYLEEGIRITSRFNSCVEFMWCATVRRQHRLPTFGPTIGSLTVTPSLVVLAFALTRICRCGVMSIADRVAMLCCSSPTACHPEACTNCSVPVADHCTSPFSIGLLQQRLVQTSRQPHPASSVGPERCCTAHLPYPTTDGLNISLPRSSAFAGCVSQNASYSNWLFWPTDPSTTLHPATYSRVSPASPTWLRDDGCGLHLTRLMYQPSVSPQSAGGRFRSLVPTFGTICRHMWHLHSHSRSSDNNFRIRRPIRVHPFISEHYYLTYSLTFSVDLVIANVI